MTLFRLHTAFLALSVVAVLSGTVGSQIVADDSPLTPPPVGRLERGNAGVADGPLSTPTPKQAPIFFAPSRPVVVPEVILAPDPTQFPQQIPNSRATLTIESPNVPFGGVPQFAPFVPPARSDVPGETQSPNARLNAPGTIGDGSTTPANRAEKLRRMRELLDELRSQAVPDAAAEQADTDSSKTNNDVEPMTQPIPEPIEGPFESPAEAPSVNPGEIETESPSDPLDSFQVPVSLPAPRSPIDAFQPAVPQPETSDVPPDLPMPKRNPGLSEQKQDSIPLDELRQAVQTPRQSDHWEQERLVDAPIDRLALADNLYAAGETVAALRVYHDIDIKEADPADQYWIQFQLAGCYRLQGNYEDAAKYYRQLVNIEDHAWMAQLARWWLNTLDARKALIQQADVLDETVLLLKEQVHADLKR